MLMMANDDEELLQLSWEEGSVAGVFSGAVHVVQLILCVGWTR